MSTTTNKKTDVQATMNVSTLQRLTGRSPLQRLVRRRRGKNHANKNNKSSQQLLIQGTFYFWCFAATVVLTVIRYYATSDNGNEMPILLVQDLSKGGDTPVYKKIIMLNENESDNDVEQRLQEYGMMSTSVDDRDASSEDYEESDEYDEDEMDKSRNSWEYLHPGSTDEDEEDESMDVEDNSVDTNSWSYLRKRNGVLFQAMADTEEEEDDDMYDYDESSVDEQQTQTQTEAVTQQVMTAVRTVTDSAGGGANGLRNPIFLSGGEAFPLKEEEQVVVVEEEADESNEDQVERSFLSSFPQRGGRLVERHWQVEEGEEEADESEFSEDQEEEEYGSTSAYGGSEDDIEEDYSNPSADIEEYYSNHEFYEEPQRLKEFYRRHPEEADESEFSEDQEEEEYRATSADGGSEDLEYDKDSVDIE